MIRVQEADQLIFDHVPEGGTEDVPWQKALGRVTTEPLTADRDQPPFDRSAMDGLAVRWDPFQQGQRQWPLGLVQRAGAPLTELPDREDSAMEIMTGAAVPRGADLVIPYEHLKIDQRRATHIPQEKQPGFRQNIQERGSEYRKGDLLLPPGTVLQSPHISVLATLGRPQVRVRALPSITLVTTGDEVVNLHSIPRDHQIRSSNAETLQAELGAWGWKSVRHRHAPDQHQVLVRHFQRAFRTSEVLVVCGGVSRGLFDLVPGALQEAGAREVFHRVAMKPGKPLWFGVGPQGQPVWGLPGNPVSALILLRRFVIPALGGRGQPGTWPLDEPVPSPELTQFLPARVLLDPPGPRLKILPSFGSGNFWALSQSHGFVEIAPSDEPSQINQAAFYFWGGTSV